MLGFQRLLEEHFCNLTFRTIKVLVVLAIRFPQISQHFFQLGFTVLESNRYRSARHSLVFLIGVIEHTAQHCAALSCRVVRISATCNLFG